jgi:rhodanese-related sulfurtransferase
MPIRKTLARVRAGLERLSAPAAYEAMRAGALLVDVRTAEQRAGGGAIAGALPVGLNVLEWRFDPDEPGHLPAAGDFARRVIVLCQDGYCSSLAAGRLRDLGYVAATDVVGGFRAWCAHGLPTVAEANTEA